MTKEVFIPKILFLVDDDPDDKDIFQEALKVIDKTIVCYTASDGKDALSKLREALFLPDVVFLDLNMPVMNGKDCLKALKQDKDLKHIPVVVYSTAEAEKEKNNCLSLGAVHFISKPPQFNILVSKLQETFQIDRLQMKK
jgi:CheY-like chemotaxis protein